jgi:DNA-directed RNA polymerase specialized sigma24 family protein
MDELNRYLQSLIQEICRHPPGSPQRRKGFNTLLRELLKPGRIWRQEDDFYEEALFEFILWLTKDDNLCKKYDPNRGPVLPWCNRYLRWRYIDAIRREKPHRDGRQSVRQTDEGERDPLDRVAAPIDSSLLLEIWESFVQWIKDDPENLLQACCKNNRKANCQNLAYLSRVEGKAWKEIAVEVGLPQGSITSHWSRKCHPLLKEWWVQNQRLFGEENDV